MSEVREAKYCSRCVYPAHAVNALLDEEGVCSACRSAEECNELATPEFWSRRAELFRELVAETRARNTHSQWDCIIPVSGGKDSYWQAHVCLEHGLRPLLVTYHGYNYLPEGQANLDRMRSELGIDHMTFGPSVGTLVRLNRIGFKLMGDMNWHAHAGIKLVPLRLAVQLGIPLMVWGEITWTVSGMYSPDDMAEYNLRTVREHDLRGYTKRDILAAADQLGEDLDERDLCWLDIPSDDDIQRVGVRGIYIGNFFNWKPNEHARLMHEKYSFEFAHRPFDRTYRTMSNLDDMHENGVHDYMKFIKFGYGRASDHASKDIRDGIMSREEGVEKVLRHDHVKPRDLERWLEYTGMSENEFDQIADGFRDRRVWWIEGGVWRKHDITGKTGSYGAPAIDTPQFVAKYTRKAEVTPA